MTTRYSRHELFLGSEAQAEINKASVIIIGAGALGSASSEMLARAGIGRVTIVDRDYVELSNLQRQQLYTEEDARNQMPKAIAAKTRLRQINSDIIINSFIEDVNGQNVEELIKNHSVIVDATDNFETSLVVNDAAVKHGIPYLFGACVGSYGLTYPIIPTDTPCLNCLLDHLPMDGMTCDRVGVISPIVQIIAAQQVTHVLKILSGKKLSPMLQSMDIWENEKAEINVTQLRKQNCPTCGEQPTYPFLLIENQLKTDVLCGRDAVQLRPGLRSDTFSLPRLLKRVENYVTNPVLNRYLLSCNIDDYRIVFFNDGRAIIHGTNEAKKAREIYNRLIQFY
ncbi:ThiF family adenylyltransferase [Ureibacillus sinduriensis]|uniref:Thiamine biosynthesis protein MoeB n=1 Tax=Ureibacillus sinduriensis BLB-1 = JCM 15800 TaxID=1384057 RepID=A0A0A3IQ47_9BACL|nr:ThiF family adenylyltransferase [Ureibacillus sinduriensis]KGR76967.1 thiamine biosynthesis protein MoeB [Ureibacillus sinduriensis BLB-1 = JCM 15800]